MDQFEAGEMIRVIFHAYRDDHSGSGGPQRLHTLAFQCATYLTTRRANYGHILGENLFQQGISLSAVYAMLVGLQRALIDQGDPAAALDVAERMQTVIMGYVAQHTQKIRSELDHARTIEAVATLLSNESGDSLRHPGP